MRHSTWELEGEDEPEKKAPYKNRMDRLIGKKPTTTKDYLNAEVLKYEDRVVEYICKALGVPTAVRKAIANFVAVEDARRYTAAGFCEVYPQFPFEFDVEYFGPDAVPFTKLGTCFSRFITSPFIKRFMQLQEELPDIERHCGLIFPYSYVTSSEAGKQNPVNAVVLHNNYHLDREHPGFHCVWHPPSDHEITSPLVLEPLAPLIAAIKPGFDSEEAEL